MNARFGPLLTHLHELGATRPEAIALVDADGEVGYRELLDLVERHPCEPTVRDVVVVDAVKSRTTVIAMLAAMRHGFIALPMDHDLPAERRNQILRQVDQHRLPARWPAEGPDAPALVLFTSGSEGVPKGVVHSQATVLAAAKRVGVMLGIEPHDRLSQLHSLTYAASCSDVWGALVNGAACHLLDPARDGPQMLINRMIEGELTRWHLVPSLYHVLLASPKAAEALRSIRSVAVGGEAVHPEIVRTHHRLAPPGCALLNRYSSTEAFGISLQRLDDPTATTATDSATVTTPTVTTPTVTTATVTTATVTTPTVSPPSPHGDADRDSGVALGSAAPGVTVIIDGATGEITVTSPSVALGYWPGTGSSIDEGRFTWPSPVGDDASMQDRSYRMGDLGRIDPDGTIVHLGRSDDLVKVAGHSISLAEVRNALIGHPDVADAFAVLHNQRIAAVVELRPSPTVRRDGNDGDGAAAGLPHPDVHLRVRAIVDDASVRLRPPARPWPVIAVEAIPRTARGKVNRTAVTALLRAAPINAGEPTEFDAGLSVGTSATVWAVRTIWIDVLGLDDLAAARLGADDDWNHVGGTSLASLEVLARLATTFGVELQPIDLARCGTIRELADAIDRSAPLHQQSKQLRWSRARRIRSAEGPSTQRRAPEPPELSTLFTLRHGEGRPTLFVPGAAGRSIQFVPLARRLGGTYPCVSVEPKGRIEPAWPDLRVEHAAARAITDLDQQGFSAPDIAVGYSMGCLVALDIAQRLVDRGTPPRWLVLLDYAPLRRVRSRRPVPWQARAETVIAPLVAGRFPELLRLPERRRNHLFFRIGQAAARRYQPLPYTGPTVIGWSDAGLRRDDAWHHVVDPSAEVAQFSGNHHSFLHEPQVSAVAHLLDRLAEPPP